MSQKHTQKIISAVLEKVSISIEERYGINRENIMNLIKDIPDSLVCKHIITRSNRVRGMQCYVLIS